MVREGGRRALGGEHIRLIGRVQGVGFRVTVEHLAAKLGARGWVRNDGHDVLVALAGGANERDAFLDALLRGLPPHARVDRVERTPAEVDGSGGFAVVATRR